MRNLNIKKFHGIAFSLALAILPGLVQGVLAQQPPQGQGQGQGQGHEGQPKKATMTVKEAAQKLPQEAKKAARPNNNIDTFGKPETITADKAMYDDIPQYTGKAKFETGAIYAPGGRNGMLMIVTYKVEEQRDQVKDWYLNALRMYGWNVTFQSPTALNACNSKTGNTITLQFNENDPTAKKKTTSLQIDYHTAVHQ